VKRGLDARQSIASIRSSPRKRDPASWPRCGFLHIDPRFRGNERIAAMVILNKIYTRTGDRRHDRARQPARGGARNTICASPPTERSMRPMPRSESRACISRAILRSIQSLARIQNDLFDAGADLATARQRQRSGRLPSHRHCRRRSRGSKARSTGSMPNSSRSAPSSCRAACRGARICILPAPFCRRAERLIAELMDKADEGRPRPRGAAIRQPPFRLSVCLPRATPTTKARWRILWRPGENR